MQFWRCEYTSISSCVSNRFFSYTYSNRFPGQNYSPNFFNEQDSTKRVVLEEGECLATSWQVELNISADSQINEVGTSSIWLNITCFSEINFNQLSNLPFFKADPASHSYSVSFDWEMSDYIINLNFVLSSLSLYLPNGHELAENINCMLIENYPELAPIDLDSSSEMSNEQNVSSVCSIS